MHDTDLVKSKAGSKLHLWRAPKRAGYYGALHVVLRYNGMLSKIFRRRCECDYRYTVIVNKRIERERQESTVMMLVLDHQPLVLTVYSISMVSKKVDEVHRRIAQEYKECEPPYYYVSGYFFAQRFATA